MFLSDVDIVTEIQKGTITLTPFDEARLQPASYDILLGNKFIVNDECATHFVDPSRKIFAKTREIMITDGEEFVLHPGISVLGISKEFFGSDHYLIQVGGKSSLARVGLMIHNTAGIINPGHFLNITFEITNQSNVPIILRPGMEIAQITFSRLTSPTKQSYKQTGRFAADNWQHFVAAKDKHDTMSLVQQSVNHSDNPEYQYLDLLRETLEHGEEQVDKGTGVKTYSVFGRQIRFDLSKGFPLLTTKRVYWSGVLHELYWFLSGQSNIKYLVDNNVHIWDDYPYKIYKESAGAGAMSKEAFIDCIRTDDTFAAQFGELPHIYGEHWRRWQSTDGRTVDQLQWVIDELRSDPDAHNTLVTSWNPEYMYSMAAAGKAARFPICHNMYQVNIKHGKVCLQLYQRSADVFLGVPFNIASYALLTIIIAKILGREPGEFVHTFGDLHIYENHKDAALEQLSRTPRALPHLEITKQFDSLDTFHPDCVTLHDYNPEATIKADLTVAGGYNEKLHKRI